MVNKVFCGSCGIAEKIGLSEIRCVKFNFTSNLESADVRRECSFFTPPVMDDGELLDPYQTLAIKEVEMASRRMKGPV